MTSRHIAAVVVAGGIAIGFGGCSRDAKRATEEPQRGGAIQLYLTETPGDVRCLELYVMTSDRSLTIRTSKFDVTPGQPATLNATGLPLEWVLLAEKAYDVLCEQVTDSTPVTWFSPTATPVEVTGGTPVVVSVTLHPAGNGSATVTVGFETPPEPCAGWTCSPWSYGRGDGCDCNCGCWDPDCNPSQGLDGGTTWLDGGSSVDGGTSSAVYSPDCARWQLCVDPGVCQDFACAGWLCPLAWYANGICDSYCGCPDPDCPDGGSPPPTEGGVPEVPGEGGVPGPACSPCAWGQAFELNNGGFQASGDITSWAWGVPTSGPGAAHGGASVWATNLAGNFRPYEDSYLTSPVIDLSAHAGREITLAWWEYVDFWAPHIATGFIEASKDGGVTWDTAASSSSWAGSAWARREVRLDASYAGSGFRFRFHLRAEQFPVVAETYPGWYIDDVCVSPGGLVGYGADFEANGAGFAPEPAPGHATSWAWGSPTSGPAAAHGGANVWATNLSGAYGFGEDGVLVSPALDLSTLAGESGLVLRWWETLQCETGYDWASVAVSKDNGLTWVPVYGPTSGLTSYPFWTERLVPLTMDYATSGVRLAFHFTSDDMANYEGWYLDDILIQGASLAACEPTGEDPPTPPCECTGVGSGGPITVECGESACGTDRKMYACSSSGWVGPGEDCPCTCAGTGPGGVPVTVSCGESTCGSDNLMYTCSESGWLGPNGACGTDGGTCSCTGTGPGGVPVTVDCGQSACGSDNRTYSCSASGWEYVGTPCP